MVSQDGSSRLRVPSGHDRSTPGRAMRDSAGSAHRSPTGGNARRHCLERFRCDVHGGTCCTARASSTTRVRPGCLHVPLTSGCHGVVKPHYAFRRNPIPRALSSEPAGIAQLEACRSCSLPPSCRCSAVSCCSSPPRWLSEPSSRSWLPRRPERRRPTCSSASTSRARATTRRSRSTTAPAHRSTWPQVPTASRCTSTATRWPA